MTMAVMLSQFPEYAQQYTQRIGGARDEVVKIMTQFRDDAMKEGYTSDEAIARMKNNSDSFIQNRGVAVEIVANREDFLVDHYQDLLRERPFGQLATFLQHRDAEVAQATLDAYKPALPLTFEGFTHAALGFLVGFFPVRSLLGIFRRKKKTQMA